MKFLIILSLSLFFCLPDQELTSVELSIIEKNIQINGKEAKVLALAQPDGTLGLTAKKGQAFNVLLKNTMQVPTSIHWHGLILPNSQDGVAFITQMPLYPNQSYYYHFPILQAGTFWMHSHFGLQEQKLLSAPLILYGAYDARIADQEVVVFLADFSFTDPSDIFQNLRCKCKNKMEMSSSKKMAMQDIVEVDYDAFLTNYRTLENPEIVEVQPGNKVRLRIINGASATNFFLFLGSLKGEAIAVDGNRIEPLQDSIFELAVAQRIDILVKIPEKGGVFPILAQGEGTNKQTGLILTTQEAKPTALSETASNQVGAFTNQQESRLRALTPLSKKAVDQRVVVELGGDMAKYVWTLNGQAWPEVTPIVVEKGQRVEIVFKNSTTMSHPMHLHGHVFQVTEIDGKPLGGAMRDTVLVMPNSSLSIQFDADNPGVWPLHCHILYHLEAGMLTVVRYKDYIQTLVPLQQVLVPTAYFKSPRVPSLRD